MWEMIFEVVISALCSFSYKLGSSLNASHLPFMKVIFKMGLAYTDRKTYIKSIQQSQVFICL